MIINYNFLVSENSNKNINNYQLEYYYMYIIRNKSKFNIIIDDDIHITNNFNHNKYFYIIFWVLKNKKKINIISDYYKDISITYLFMKTEDSYVLSHNKLFTHINDIINQQHLDLTYSKYDYNQILSSVWLNILTSNKLLCHKYFIDKKIIKNTVIKKLNFNEISKYSKDYIIKAPYSSGNYCAKLYKLMNSNCFIDEGVIISKINYEVLKNELKIYTFKGKILYCNVKSIKSNNLTLNDNLEIVPNSLTLKNGVLIDGVTDKVVKINKYKKEIKKMCKKVYELMNEFVILMKAKLIYELKHFIIPLKLNKTLFYNFFDNMKINKLEELKNKTNEKQVNKYINYIKLKPEHIKKLFNIEISKEDYMDYFMRIDLMLPDYKNYSSLTLLEIEPFACGKGFIKNIMNAIKIKETDIKPKSAQDLVFSKYIQECIKDNIKFNWQKIN